MRIHEFFVGDERLDKDKTYKAAFVTTQGIPAGYGADRKDLDIDAISALKRYVQENGPVRPAIEGTIVAI